MGYQFKIAAGTLIALLFFKACDKAPKYVKPGVATPPAFKEISPDMFKETKDWKYARPNDDVMRGKWWEMFGDSKLNANHIIVRTRILPVFSLLEHVG